MTIYYKAVSVDAYGRNGGAGQYCQAMRTGEVISHNDPDLESIDTDATRFLSVADIPTATAGGYWPIKAFEVEAVGPAVKPLYFVYSGEPHATAVAALRVVREIPAHVTLGPYGQAVAKLLDQCIAWKHAGLDLPRPLPGSCRFYRGRWREATRTAVRAIWGDRLQVVTRVLAGAVQAVVPVWAESVRDRYIAPFLREVVPDHAKRPNPAARKLPAEHAVFRALSTVGIGLTARDRITTADWQALTKPWTDAYGTGIEWSWDPAAGNPFAKTPAQRKEPA